MSSSESTAVRSGHQRLTYVGCYTSGAGGDGDGIVRTWWDETTGAFTAAVLSASTPSPSYLVRHPRLPVLYAANELDDGTLSAFSVAADGGLVPLGTWPSGGSYPCHLNLDPDGRHLLVANYGSGTVSALLLSPDGVPTGQADTVAHSGQGSNPQRQEGPHAHTVVVVPEGVLAVDLGVDTVFRYRLDPDTGRLGDAQVAFRTRPGTGPRHLVWDHAGRMHLVGELDATVTTYERDAEGWREVGRVPTGADDTAIPSEIGMSGDGRFLYVANRGPDTISTFCLTTGSPASGVPVLVGEVASGGAWPRHFAVNGAFLAVANQRSGAVVPFRLDPATGLPTPTGDILATPSPTCVLPY